MAPRRGGGGGGGRRGGGGGGLARMVGIVVVITACTIFIAVNALKTRIYKYHAIEHAQTIRKQTTRITENEDTTTTTTTTTTTERETHERGEDDTASFLMKSKTATVTRVYDTGQTNNHVRAKEDTLAEIRGARRRKADELLFPATHDKLEVEEEEVVVGTREESSPCVASIFRGKMPPPPRESHRGFLHALERELCSVTRGGESRAVVVTFANSAYSEMLSNVVHSLRVQGVRGILVGALDADVEKFARQELGVAAIQVGNETALMDTETILAKMNANQLLIDGNIAQGSGNFRTDAVAFTNMGVKKGSLVRAVLSLGFDAIVSDTDVVWHRDPTGYFAGSDHGAEHNRLADLLVSSDCFSGGFDVELRTKGATRLASPGGDAAAPERDASGRRWWENVGPRNNEMNGNCLITVFNTGVLFFQATAVARALADDWIRNMLSGGAYALRKTRDEMKGHVMDDQTCLNHLVRDGPPRIADTDPRSVSFKAPLRLVEGGGGNLFWAYNATLRMGYLPLELFANGYTHWVERLSERRGILPFAAHATTTFHGYDGKVARFMMDGAWWAEEDAGPKSTQEAQSARERVLMLRLREEDYPSQVFNTSVSLVERHMWALSHTAIAVRNGFAAARALQRTLVLPQMRCFCDRYFNNVLPHCRSPGSEVELPFTCPLDHVFNPSVLKSRRAKWPFEVPEQKLLLSSSPSTMSRNTQRRVIVAGHDKSDGGAAVTDFVQLPLYPTDAELRSALAFADDAEVVELVSPATSFCRFENDDVNRELDAAESMFESTWCCWHEGRLVADKPMPMIHISAGTCAAAARQASSLESSSSISDGYGNVHAAWSHVTSDVGIVGTGTPASVLMARRAMNWTLANPDYIKRTFNG